MNHCPLLEEIVELPSSLTEMDAHGCPCLETETFSSPLWSSLLKYFKSPIQRGDLSFQEVVEYQSGSSNLGDVFPQINIPREYRSSWWNNFKAHFHTQIGYGSFSCGDNTCFKVKSCGIHLLYAQDQIHCPQPSRGSLGDGEDHPAKRLKIP
ncbi:hypothetical protein AAG906_016230 [Vitis piasezkii]